MLVNIVFQTSTNRGHYKMHRYDEKHFSKLLSNVYYQLQSCRSSENIHINYLEIITENAACIIAFCANLSRFDFIYITIKLIELEK
jgi:hypothetical protein